MSMFTRIWNKNRLSSTTCDEDLQKDWQRLAKFKRTLSKRTKKATNFKQFVFCVFWPLNDLKTLIWPDPPNIVWGARYFQFYEFFCESNEFLHWWKLRRFDPFAHSTYLHESARFGPIKFGAPLEAGPKEQEKHRACLDLTALPRIIIPCFWVPR